MEEIGNVRCRLPHRGGLNQFKEILLFVYRHSALAKVAEVDAGKHYFFRVLRRKRFYIGSNNIFDAVAPALARAIGMVQNEQV